MNNNQPYPLQPQPNGGVLQQPPMQPYPAVAGYPYQQVPYPPQPMYQNNVQSVEQEMQTQEVKKKLRLREIDKIVPRKSGNGLNSVQIRPNLTFATQNPGEKIYILARRHWIKNIGWITRNLFYSTIPFILWIFFSVIGLPLPTDMVANRVYTVILMLFYSVILTNVVRDFFDWYFDPYIVTNERVLDFTFNPFTNYSVEEASLEDIVTVKQKTSGIVGAIFNYGDVTISTEAFTDAMVFEAASKPARVRDIVSDLSKIAKTYSNAD
jgi:hypothetical protein